MMNRTRKQEVVADFKDKFSKSQATFIVQYQGIDVISMQRLRCELRKKNALLKVTKARLMKQALKDVPEIDLFLDDLKTQVALVFAQDEVPAVAKVLAEFAKNQKKLKLIAGFFEDKRIDADRVAFLSALPSHEVLMAQIAGTINEIIARIPRAIQLANEKQSGESASVEVVAE